MVKFLKYIFITLLFVIIIIASYFVFESLSAKKSINYQSIDEIPKINWLNIRSGIFGLVMKSTNDKTFISYDKTKYITIIVPKENEFNSYSEIPIYYLANGVNYDERENTKLFNYTAVYKTKFKNNIYLLFLQKNIQKNGKVGLLLTAYPVNLIQDNNVGKFIRIITNQSLPAPIFSPIYKFDSPEKCKQEFKDEDYCNWFILNQRSIHKIVKIWSDTGVIPINMTRYPLFYKNINNI